jgi:hypothetical protein
MEGHSSTYRTSGSIPSGSYNVPSGKEETLLGDSGVRHGSKAKLSSVGIQGWTSLLVYKWDDLQGPGTKQLAKEDEIMPAMQSVPNPVASLG